MKTLILAAVRCSLMFSAVTAPLFCVRPAQAFTVTIDQVGSNVVANGSGAFNLMGLTLSGIGLNGVPLISGTAIQIGAAPHTILDRYIGFTGPTTFGTGFAHLADTGIGDFVAIYVNFFSSLYVPPGYVSGAALSDSMTFNNATFASLGVTPGTYVWSWGTGLPNQNFTLIIGGVGVPDGGTTISLLGCALLGLAAFRRKLSC
jgi:hypothetical protein